MWDNIRDEIVLFDFKGYRFAVTWAVNTRIESVRRRRLRTSRFFTRNALFLAPAERTVSTLWFVSLFVVIFRAHREIENHVRPIYKTYFIVPTISGVRNFLSIIFIIMNGARRSDEGDL